MIRFHHLVSVPAFVMAAMLVGGRETMAHKPITSPYTYNEDVFPIVRDRCGHCHVTGGVAPMSLMTYKDAFPWGESIRTELVAGHMPPWTVDTGTGTYKNAQALSARELNVLLTWVTGGNPIGNTEHTPPPVQLPSDWSLGPPDLIAEMPAAFTIAADLTEQTQEFTLPVQASDGRRVRAVDLMPGNPAIVRSATVSVKSTAPPRSASATSTSSADAVTQGTGGAVTGPEHVLAIWVPGEKPVPLEDGLGFPLPRNSELMVRVHYKKTWEHEREAMSDRTRVGLYFAREPAVDVSSLALSPSKAAADRAGYSRADRPAANGESRVSFTQSVDEDLRAVAIYPDASLANASVEVTAVRRDGTRAELIRFRPQPDWARRYWFAAPVSLPKGTQITVAASYGDALLPPGAAPIAPKPPDPSTLRLILNVVPSR